MSAASNALENLGRVNENNNRNSSLGFAFYGFSSHNKHTQTGGNNGGYDIPRGVSMSGNYLS
jgi:hypothetical protein